MENMLTLFTPGDSIYGYCNGFFGREFFGQHRRADLPPSVRQTPGAYRTFLHNNGFHGGK